ncbi:hypothetical protein [Pseudoteredinibacter isoporae]|uniref:hypothetical protein n=1 Tax=Pseudoteredinibacter isoporae TaxID=570281 RepID=UPI00310BA338
MSDETVPVANDTQASEAQSTPVHDIEALLEGGKSLDDILDLDPAAAGSDTGGSSSVANAVRFDLNGTQVIPLAGFDTHAAGDALFPVLPQEQNTDNEVFAELSVRIIDGGDGRLNQEEAQSVLIQGQASGIEAAAGSVINLTIRNQDGLSLLARAITDANGQYQVSMDLSSFQDGDLITAIATLSDLAGNQLSSQDQSLIDLSVQGDIRITIDDGGDGVINQEEQSAVTIRGRYRGDEALPNQQLIITVSDDNGQLITVPTTLDDQNNIEIVVDLSGFEGEVRAIARLQDLAGNSLSAEDRSRIDALLDGDLSIVIMDGGDELLNFSELTHVEIRGQISSEEIQSGSAVTLLIQDESGHLIAQTVFVDDQGQYQTVVNLSDFQHGDIVSATASVQDAAGNTLIAEDRSRIDALYDGDIRVNIIDGGDELINIADAQSTTISGQVNRENSASPTVQLLIEDQSGNRLNTQADISADGQYSVRVDFNSFNQGDTITVTASTQDIAGNTISANDTSVLEAPAPLPLLQANDDEHEFHGHDITGNVINGSGADLYTGPVHISRITYRGIDIDLNTAVTMQAAVTNNGQNINYTVSASGQLTLNNMDEQSYLTFDQNGDYQFQVGTQNVENNEQIQYTLMDGFGQSDTARLTLIVPTNNADTLTGTNNTTMGDTLFGLAGNDDIRGLDGNDNISGGNGADSLYGDEGDDQIQGDSGFDELHGGQGNDTLEGGNGKDRLYGDEGNDHIDGGAWDDLIYGGIGNDTLIGNTGMDIILGEDGMDNIHGGDWDDSISGGDGNDIIRGGRGLDVMDGGAGSDTFIFNQQDNGSSSQTNQDTIYHFDTSEDIINLTDLLTNYDPGAGDSIIDFLDIQFLSIEQMLPNTDHQNAIPGNVRPTFNNGTVDTIIRIDIDGDGSFSGNTQEIVLADLDLSNLGNNETDILQTLINLGVIIYD